MPLALPQLREGPGVSLARWPCMRGSHAAPRLMAVGMQGRRPMAYLTWHARAAGRFCRAMEGHHPCLNLRGSSGVACKPRSGAVPGCHAPPAQSGEWHCWYQLTVLLLEALGQPLRPFLSQVCCSPGQLHELAALTVEAGMSRAGVRLLGAVAAPAMQCMMHEVRLSCQPGASTVLRLSWLMMPSMQWVL